jgi:electron transfer flavoprotein-quinone oxidoreductase
MLVAGDAAALCLAAGIWLEGVNFAMASGMYAGRAAVHALQAPDRATMQKSLGSYTTMLRESFVLQDHRKLAQIPHLVLSDRVQHQYPGFVANVVERMFRVDNPAPKPGLRRIVREERKRAGIRWRDLVRDARTGLKGFG